MEFKKEIDLLIEKGNKYDHLKDRHDHIVEQLTEVKEFIDGIINDVNPKITTRRMDNETSNNIFQKCIKLLQDGEFLSVDDIKRNNSLEEASAGYIFSRLKKVSHVLKRKNELTQKKELYWEQKAKV